MNIDERLHQFFGGNCPHTDVIGACYECTKELVEQAVADEHASQEKRMNLAMEALKKLADHDCGCRPCHKQCRTGKGAEIELEERMAIAQEALDHLSSKERKVLGPDDEPDAEIERVDCPHCEGKRVEAVGIPGRIVQCTRCFGIGKVWRRVSNKRCSDRPKSSPDIEAKRPPTCNLRWNSADIDSDEHAVHQCDRPNEHEGPCICWCGTAEFRTSDKKCLVCGASLTSRVELEKVECARCTSALCGSDITKCGDWIGGKGDDIFPMECRGCGFVAMDKSEMDKHFSDKK